MATLNVAAAATTGSWEIAWHEIAIGCAKKLLLAFGYQTRLFSTLVFDFAEVVPGSISLDPLPYSLPQAGDDSPRHGGRQCCTSPDDIMAAGGQPYARLLAVLPLNTPTGMRRAVVVKVTKA